MKLVIKPATIYQKSKKHSSNLSKGVQEQLKVCDDDDMKKEGKSPRKFLTR